MTVYLRESAGNLGVAGGYDVYDDTLGKYVPATTLPTTDDGVDIVVDGAMSGEVSAAWFNVDAAISISGTVNVVNYVTVGNTAAASVAVSGSWTDTGGLHIGNNFTSSVEVGVGATEKTYDDIVIGDVPDDAIGTLTVDGGSVTTDDTFDIGVGSANVSDGGVVTADVVYMGGGADAAMTIDDGTFVDKTGFSVDGEVKITDGGTLSSAGIAFPDGHFDAIGLLAGATGQVTVDGKGSQWTTTGAIIVADAEGSFGFLTIEDDAVVTATHEIDVGESSTGTVVIQSGGKLYTGGYENPAWGNYGTIGYSSPTGISSLTVTGAGSQWISTAALTLYSGKLEVELGGDVELANQLGMFAGAVVSLDETGSIEVGASGAGSQGAVTIGLGASLYGAGTVDSVVDNSGTITVTGGVMTIVGPVEGTGVAEIEADGTLDLQDSIATTETITFAAATGTLEVEAAKASAKVVVSGFASDDVIDLPNVGYAGGPGVGLMFYNPNLVNPLIGTANQIEVMSGGDPLLNVNFGGNADFDQLVTQPDGHGGTEIVLSDTPLTAYDFVENALTATADGTTPSDYTAADTALNQILALRGLNATISSSDTNLRDAEYWLRGYLGGLTLKNSGANASDLLQDPVNIIGDVLGPILLNSYYLPKKQILAAFGANVAGSGQLPASPVGGYGANVLGYQAGLQGLSLQAALAQLQAGGDALNMSYDPKNPLKPIIDVALPIVAGKVASWYMSAVASGTGWFDPVTNAALVFGASGNTITGIEIEGASATFHVSAGGTEFTITPGQYQSFSQLSGGGVGALLLSGISSSDDDFSVGFTFAQNAPTEVTELVDPAGLTLTAADAAAFADDLAVIPDYQVAVDDTLANVQAEKSALKSLIAEGLVSSLTATAIAGEPYSSYVDRYDAAGNLTEKSFVYTSSAGAAYSSNDDNYAPGNQFIGTQLFYTGIENAPYTSYESDYDGGGNLTRESFTSVASSPYSSFEYDFVGGVYAGAKLTYADPPAGAAYSSFEVDYDAANAFAGEKLFYTATVGQSYASQELDIDANAQVTRILLTGVTGQGYTSLEEDFSGGVYSGYTATYAIKGEPFATEQVQVSAAGALESVTYSAFRSAAYTSLTQTFVDNAVTTTEYNFTDVTAKNYFAYQVSEDDSGGALSEVFDLVSGGHSQIALASGQTLSSLGLDKMTGDGATTFVLNAIYGADTITNFNSDDTISLTAGEYSQLSAAMAGANYSSGNATLTFSDGDTLTLKTMTEAQLESLQGHFVSHS